MIFPNLISMFFSFVIWLLWRGFGSNMITKARNLLLGVLLVYFVSCAESAGSRNSKDWDYIVYTQHWPATVCLQWKAEGKGHSCALPKESTWTVHGLWPSKTNGKGPFFCNSSLPFDEEALSPIVNELEDLWINIDVPTSPYSFWRHEWEKHGTCAAALPAFDKEVKYFQQGLTWLKKYNMYTALDLEGYPEGKPLSAKQIREAIKKHFGKVPSVHCYKDGSTGKSYIFEIRICFDRNLSQIDCPKPMSSNCPNEPVEYPSMQAVSKLFEVKGKWLLDLLRIVRWIQWITY